MTQQKNYSSEFANGGTLNWSNQIGHNYPTQYATKLRGQRIAKYYAICLQVMQTQEQLSYQMRQNKAEQSTPIVTDEAEAI
jgi:hypothetical protein